MKSRRLFTVLLASLCVVTEPRGAFSCYDEPECTLPPVGPSIPGITGGAAWPVGETVGGTAGTNDAKYVIEWMADSPNALFAGLKIHTCDWDEGWGLPEYWQLNKPLSRLMNGAHVVRVVEDHARYFGFWRWVDGIPSILHVTGRGWTSVGEWGEDEWEPSCEDGGAIASHRQDTDEYNKLHIPGAYRTAATRRASTLVHEITHQEIDHEDEDDCLPASTSCDAAYGNFNANTMQINFLHDAAATFRLKTVNGKTVREVFVDGDDCGFLPRFDDDEISTMMDRANEVMNRFVYDFFPGWKFALVDEVNSAWEEASWDCEHCDPGKNTFDPGVCIQPACNEFLNSGNVSVNDANRDACHAYNLAVDGGLTEDGVAIAQQDYQNTLQSCLAPSDEGVSAYCDAQKAGANHVDDLDPCGWMESSYSAKEGKLACVQEFCHDYYQPFAGGDPADDWTPRDDPAGCIDYLCDSSCGSPEDRERCLAGFRIGHGDLAYQLPTCEIDKCKARLLDCLIPIADAGEWKYGDPLPESCSLEHKACEATSRLAALAFVDRKPFLDPGPLREKLESLLVPTPAKNVYDYADALRLAAATGPERSAELDHMAVRFTAAPEMISALYNASPEEFVGLFGRDGFREILGPTVERVPARAIDPEELGEIGLRAWNELQRMLMESPDGKLPSAIGTIQSTASN